MKGTEIAKQIIQDGLGKGFLVYFDPDVDGVFSGVLPVKFLKDKEQSYKITINDDRAHGFLKDELLQNKEYKTIISVDALVPREKIREIVKAGYNIVSLDHHICEEEFILEEHNGYIGIVINNQYPFELESKRFLSGAGVVYEAFCEMFPEINFNWFRDIVGITLLSDIRDISSENAKEYLHFTFTSAERNTYVNYLITQCLKFKKDFGWGKPKLDRNFIDFTLSPIINSALRFNKGMDIIEFALGRGLKESLVEDQRELIRETLKNYITVKNLKHISFIKVEDWREDVNLSNFIGLVANNMLGKERNNILCFIVRKNGTSRASFRSENYKFNFLEGMRKLGYNALGHEGAFGIIDFINTKVPVNLVDDMCAEASKIQIFRNVVEVKNLGMFDSSGKARQIAEDNNYCNSSDRVYVKYIGSGAKTQESTEKYTRHQCDGVKVMSFNSSNSIYENLIDLSTTKGVVQFVLTDLKESL